MFDFLAHFLYKIFLGREGAYMVAMLWANQILLGKKDFDDVPARLKAQVKELLLDAGYAELAGE